ncbi:MAG: PAS domain-containing protein [Elusimicrobia bacterium]|nr:PAS domain-containing protein [Elusimicrobiota bacterium]
MGRLLRRASADLADVGRAKTGTVGSTARPESAQYSLFSRGALAGAAAATRLGLKVRQKALFDNIPEVAWVKDSSGRFVAASRRFAEACGVPQKRLIGRTDWDVWPEDFAGRHAEQEGKVAATFKPARSVFSSEGPNGRSRWTEIVRTPILGEDGALIGTLGIARDVSQYRQAAARLRRASRQVIRAREEEKRKIANFLHDELGSLIMRTKTAIFLAGEELKGGSPVVLGKLKEAGGALGELASAVRRIAGDIRPPSLGMLGLAGAVAELSRRLEACSGAKVECFARIKDESRIEDLVKVMVYRMVQEAAGNAIKHASPRTIKIRLIGSGSSVMFSVSDDGRGFDPDTVCAAAGSCLGLKIMREEAESMCGEVVIRSAPGFGTSVRGTLPARPGSNGGDNADQLDNR